MSLDSCLRKSQYENLSIMDTVNLLSNSSDDPLEGVLPGIHLDHPDPSNHLIHDTYSLISKFS